MEAKIKSDKIKTIREQALFNGKHFHFFIYNKTESVTGLHQHDYYELTLVLTGRYYQEVNGKEVLLERGDFVFIPLGSHHQSSYKLGTCRLLNIGISQAFFDKHYLALLPACFVASQSYRLKSQFLSYIEAVIASSAFQSGDFAEFLETVTFHSVNSIRHYKQDSGEAVPLWLRHTLEAMHDKQYFADKAIHNMVTLAGKTQEHLTRATRRYFNKTPMQIIHEIRINYAKRQLEVTNDSVEDIAYDCGYNDVSLFIKNFKKLISLTPGNYRKEYFSIK
ncbi:MAG: transcriptional regulator ChbR [Enterobacteriaceae bacterium]